jgi:hypothetical protein
LTLVLRIVLLVGDDSAFMTLFIVVLFEQTYDGTALGTPLAIMPNGLIRKIALGLALFPT